MSNGSTSAQLWTPGAFVASLSKVLMFAVIYFGVVHGVRHLYPLIRTLEYSVAASVVILLALVFLAMLVHESGHFLAARANRMAVLRIQFGPLQWLLQRGRSRLRWDARGHWLGGGVMAMPRLDGSFRGQLAWLVSGGPLANLVLALLAWSVAGGMAGQTTEAWLRSFAVLNLMVCVCNLLPTAGGTDGVQLVRLAKGMDLGQPGTEMLEANIRAFAGQGAEKLPEALIQGVDREVPIVGQWFRLFASVRRDDWEGIQAVEVRLNEMESALDRASREGWSVLLGLMRAEIAFARGLREGVLPPLEGPLLKELPYHRPGFRERHQALAHALAGNWEACRAALVGAEREAAFNPDPASRDTETLLRRRVISLLPASSQPSTAAA